MNVKILLVSESGEVLDSTDPLSAAEFNAARNNGAGAWALLNELRQVAEQ